MLENILRKLRVHVTESDLPEGWWGAYDHATRTIHLHCTLAPLQRRSTLSHELAHAVLKHDGHSVTQEREAEELSATWLIRFCEFHSASRIYDTSTALAHELGVLPRDIHAYTRFLERGHQYGHP